MDGMTSRGETSGHTRRLRSGDLGALMRTGYHRTMEYVQARLEQLGFDDVRPAHMAIFQNLGPEGARIGELADRAKLTNQSVGYLVDYLEEHGYVERRPDPANRRATLVCFTERGWDEADACAKILDQLDEELTTRMGTERLEQLQALLAEAAAALQASKLAIPAPRGRPRSRHPAPSGAVRQPPRGALATYLCARHQTRSIAWRAWTPRTERSARCNPRSLH
jgi:DNA-binding MarR family transcriptional regulator